MSNMHTVTDEIFLCLYQWVILCWNNLIHAKVKFPSIMSNVHTVTEILLCLYQCVILCWNNRIYAKVKFPSVMSNVDNKVALATSRSGQRQFLLAFVLKKMRFPSFHISVCSVCPGSTGLEKRTCRGIKMETLNFKNTAPSRKEQRSICWWQWLQVLLLFSSDPW